MRNANSPRSRTAGGYLFPCTPDLPAEDAPALWAPHAAVATVVLDTAPDDYVGARSIDLDALGCIVADRRLSNGRHLVLSDSGDRHRIWLRDATPGRRLATIIPIDDHYRLRAAVATRLWRWIEGEGGSEVPIGLMPTPFQRRRLVLFLDLLDASLAGANPRDMARTLVYPHMPDLRSAAWKDSPERRRTRLLVSEARKLMGGGYRALLAGR